MPPPAPSRDLQLEMNGKTYSASYTVSGGVVTVETWAGQKATQIGANVEATAKMLLRELIREGKA